MSILLAVGDQVQHFAYYAAAQKDVFLAELTNPSAQPPDKVTGKIMELLGWLKWGAIVAGLAGLFICAIMMMLGRRGKSQTAVEGAVGIPWVLAGLLLLAVGYMIVNTVVK